MHFNAACSLRWMLCIQGLALVTILSPGCKPSSRSGSTAAQPVQPPAAPSGLGGAAVSHQQVDLVWQDNSPDEAGFEIERSDDGASFVRIASVAADTVAFSDGNLSEGTTYHYRVRAHGAGGTSAYSNTHPVATVPSPPTDLLAMPVSHQQVDLTWSDNSLVEEGFDIERSTDGQSFQKIADVPTNVTAFMDPAVSGGTTFFYRVFARSSTGNSVFSNIVGATLPPTAPTDLVAMPVSHSRIDLAWQRSPSNETSFEIEQSTDGVSFLPIASVAPDTLLYSDGNLAAETTYHYRVRAHGASGPSQYSNTATATTLPPPKLVRGPFLAEVTTQSIVVAWSTDVPGIGRVEYSLDQSYSSSVTEASPATAHAVTITGLDAGRTYSYQVLTAGRVLASGRTFAAARARDDPRLRFVAFGDCGTGTLSQRQVAALVQPANPDFALLTGDIIYDNGEAEDFNPRYFVPYAGLIDHLPFYTTPGNHDVRTDDGQPYLDAFYLPHNNPLQTEKYYSFDAAHAHIISIDTTQSSLPGSPMRTWLEQDLQSPEAASAVWRFVFFHNPPFSSGENTSNLTVRKNLQTLLATHDVDMVFNGDSHAYERTYPMLDSVPVDVDAAQDPNYVDPTGVIYIVTGGGGRDLHVRTEFDNPFTARFESVHHLVRVDIDGRTLTLTAIDKDGAPFDSMTLSK